MPTGSSRGLLLITIRDLRVAIEPSNIARRFAQEEVGVEIIAESSLGLDGWSPEEPVDLVVFSHVLEYFADPNPVLAAIRRVIPKFPLDCHRTSSTTRFKTVTSST